METLRILTSSHLWLDLDDFKNTIDVKKYDLCFFQQLPQPISFKLFSLPHQYVSNNHYDVDNEWNQLGLCITNTTKYHMVGDNTRCYVKQFDVCPAEKLASTQGRHIQQYKLCDLKFINCYPLSASHQYEDGAIIDENMAKNSVQELINMCDINTVLIGIIPEKKLDRTFIYKGLTSHSKNVNKVITRTDSNITITNINVEDRYTTFDLTF